MEEVARFVITHGQSSDITIKQQDGTLFLNITGSHIDRIADMEYREELLIGLIPLQSAAGEPAEDYSKHEMEMQT